MPRVEGEKVTEIGMPSTYTSVKSSTFSQSNPSILDALSEEDRTEACLISSPLASTFVVRPTLKSDFKLRSIDPRLSLCSTRCPPSLAGWEFIERES